MQIRKAKGSSAPRELTMTELALVIGGARTKQTARKSTGGMAPRKLAADGTVIDDGSDYIDDGSDFVFG